MVASSRQRKKGKEKKKPSLKPFQTWLVENMEKGNEHVWVFFFFFYVFCLVGIFFARRYWRPTMCNVEL